MTAAFTPKQVRSSRIKLVLLWAIPIGLMIIAFPIMKLYQSGAYSYSTINKGILIQPHIQLNALTLTTDVTIEEETLWTDKWSIVVRGGADCDSECLDTLLLTRQTHILLNKEANRVQRIYLSTDPELNAELIEHLATENHYMKLAYVDEPANENTNELILAELDRALTSSNEQAQFFIVDPNGWAMMYYLNEHNGAAILKDLKRLLKYSKGR